MCPFFLTTLTLFTYFIQGGLFNWRPPKNHNFLLVSECFQKKVRVSRLAPPPKISKCQPVFGNKLKYPDWPPLKSKSPKFQNFLTGADT